MQNKFGFNKICYNGNSSFESRTAIGDLRKLHMVERKLHIVERKLHMVERKLHIVERNLHMVERKIHMVEE